MDVPKVFEYNDILSYTNNFSAANFIESGGFGDVYMGLIAQGNKYGLTEQFVAVKRGTFDVNKKTAMHQQFEAEMKYMSRISHPNIVKLLGYCFHGEERCLVLEYVDGGKLTNSIQGLNWKETMNITHKIGKAIQYIHSLPGGCVHGDIKTDNILLTAGKEPKLIDFGTFSIEVERNENPRPPVHTKGYIDPDWMKRSKGIKTPQDDVYAYGVIILQLIMKFNGPIKESQRAVGTNESNHVSDFAWDLLKKKKTAVHDNMLSSTRGKEAKNITELALDLTATLETYAEDVGVEESVRNHMASLCQQEATDTIELEDADVMEVEGSEYFVRPPIGDVLRRLDNLRTIDKYEPLSKRCFT